MSVNHLNAKILNKVTDRLYSVQGSLKGVSGLFMLGGRRELDLEDAQFFGVGQLLEKLAEEVGILEDILTSGQDSMADVRNGMDKDKEDADDLEVEEEKNANVSKEGNISLDPKVQKILEQILLTKNPSQ